MDRQLSIVDPLTYTMHEHADLQTLGRIGQINQEYNKSFLQMIVCVPKALPKCFLALEKDFDRTTPVLQFYARQCQVNKTNAHELFWHIHDYQSEARTIGFSKMAATVNKYSALSLDHIFFCLRETSPHYTSTIINWYAQGASLLPKKEDEKRNSRIMYQLLKKGHMLAAKIFLIGNPTLSLFNNGCNDLHPDRLPYGDCRHCYHFLPYHVSILQLLFQRGDAYSIMQALELDTGNYSSWKELLMCVLKYAKEYGHQSMIGKLLRQHYEKTYPIRWDIYWHAITADRHVNDIIDVFFSDNINQKHEPRKRSLLDYAVTYIRPDVVEYLFKKGIDPWEIDSLGEPIFHRAYNSKKIIRMFLKAGVDIDIANNNEDSALLALPRRYKWNKKIESIFRTLLECKANVNKQNNRGKTILHYFAEMKEGFNTKNSDQVIQMMIPVLLQYGARLDIKDNYGLIPFDYAERHNNGVVMAMLTPKKQDLSKLLTFCNSTTIMVGTGMSLLGLYLLTLSTHVN